MNESDNIFCEFSTMFSLFCLFLYSSCLWCATKPIYTDSDYLLHIAHVNQTLHTSRAFSIPPHPGSLVRRAIRRPHHRLRPTQMSTTSEALYNTVRPHWICQSSWAPWNIWIRSQSCCERLWLLFPCPPLVLPCWFVLYSNGSCSPIAHHNTDSDHGAYALRPEPWQELLPSQSCFTYLTESLTSTDYPPPPSLQEAQVTWNSDCQIPVRVTSW